MGVVNKVGLDHIGLLVLGAFNASIGLADTAGAFEEHIAEVRRSLSTQGSNGALSPLFKLFEEHIAEVRRSLSTQGSNGALSPLFQK